MKRIKKYIDRDYSVISNEKNLEHLYTFKDFPVFMGCTESKINNDIYADMVWKIDKKNGLVQLSKLIPLDILYMDQHMDATGSTWDRYNDNLSNFILENHNGNILEIGGGSGKLANRIVKQNNNIKYTVVEPNPTFTETENIKVIKKFFSEDFKILDKSINTIVLSQVLEHVYDPIEFLTNIYDKLSEGGLFVFGYPNLEHLFSNKFTNAINFEHTMLMTDFYVDYFLNFVGFEILKKYDYENHSHFYCVRKNKEKVSKQEFDMSDKYSVYKKMFNEYIKYHLEMVKNINNIIREKENVFLFGAHIFSQYLFAFGLDIKPIISILDNSPIKIGKRLYGYDIDVNSPKILSNYKNPTVILKAGLYNQEIKEDIINNINSETKFI